jgi:hypothetical protein
MARYQGLSWIITCVGIFLVALLSGCALGATPTEDPLQNQIATLQFQQAALRTQLAQLEPQSTATRASTRIPLATPTPELQPSPTPPAEKVNLLPQPLYYLGLDEAGISQVFRLEANGLERTQITSGNRMILDYDISPLGDLAYILQENADSPMRLVLLPASEATEVVIEERSNAQEAIQNIRWLPNGDQFVYHRSVEVTPAGAAENEPTPESRQFYSELVLYNRLTKNTEVLLDRETELTSAIFTNESLEYDAGIDWQVTYQVTGFTPDSRYLLLNDSGGPFWIIYDLRTQTARQVRIIASSADLMLDGQSLCLASDLSKPEFQPPQALLCGNIATNSLKVHLNHPPWQPVALNLWADDNAVVFLQFSPSETEGGRVEVYGYNLTEAEPLLLREEALALPVPANSPLEALYAPQENTVEGLVVLAGQAQAMPSPGLILLPMDAQKPAIYLPELGEMRRLRWGPNP